MEQVWTRTVEEKFGPVEQFVRVDRTTGELFGWEIYENGQKSDEVNLQTKTLPLGFQRVEK